MVIRGPAVPLNLGIILPYHGLRDARGCFLYTDPVSPDLQMLRLARPAISSPFVKFAWRAGHLFSPKSGSRRSTLVKAPPFHPESNHFQEMSVSFLPLALRLR